MTNRDRTILAVLVALGMLAAAWFLLIQPRRDQAAKLATQISAAQLQLSTARAAIAQGQAARTAFGRDYASLARLGEAVPADDNVPSLIVQLQAAARAARVDFRSLALSGSSTPSSPSTAPGSAVSGSVLPPGATIGPAGFPVEPFTFTFRGNFFHLSDFFGRLERFVVASNNRVSVSGRLIALNAISLQAAPQGFPQIDATISASTYLVPASQGVLAGATSAGPGASIAQPVSTSSGSGSPAPTAAVTP